LNEFDGFLGFFFFNFLTISLVVKFLKLFCN